MRGFPSASTSLVLIALVLGFGQHSSERAMSLAQPNQYSPRPFGLYRINGQAPKGFETFYEFELNLSPSESPSSIKVDQKGGRPIDGALFIRPVEFSSATKTEQRGELSNSGDISFVNVVRLKFVSATLQVEGDRLGEISLVTEEMDGTSYSFDGRFLDEPTLDRGVYVALTGTIKKFKHGRQMAEASLKFLRWAYE